MGEGDVFPVLSHAPAGLEYPWHTTGTFWPRVTRLRSASLIISRTARCVSKIVWAVDHHPALSLIFYAVIAPKNTKTLGAILSSARVRGFAPAGLRRETKGTVSISKAGATSGCSWKLQDHSYKHADWHTERLEDDCHRSKHRPAA